MTNSNSTTGLTGSNGLIGSTASVSNSGANQHVVSRDASVDSGSSLSSLQSGQTNARSDDARIGQALSDDALSTIADDDDTIMNDGNELLEFDFDSDVQPLGWNEQASMAREIKMLQKRLLEATRLSLTMPEDSALASNAGALKRQLIMAKENYQLLFDDIVQAGTSTNPNVNGLLPLDIPQIQWKDHKFNVKRFIFPTMKACFEQFEDVLESDNIEIETNWKRLIKPKMSTGMANWTRDLIRRHPSITWGQFKHNIKAKYSSSEADETKAALAKLKTLKLDNCENLEDFIDRFNSLKQSAGVTENGTLVDYLVRGLDIDLYTSVSTGIAQVRGAKGSDTLDSAAIIGQLRSSEYDLFRRDYYYIEEKKRKDEEWNTKIKDGIKEYQRSSEGLSSASDGNHYRQKQTRCAGRNHEKQHSKNTGRGEQVLKCYDCGFTPFTYARKATCKKNPKNIKKASKKRSNSIVPKPAADDENDISSSDEEGDQTFAVATFSNKRKGKKEEIVSMDTDSECKPFLSSEYFKKMPSNNMNTNGLLYLPVILESSNGVKVNT